MENIYLWRAKVGEWGVGGMWEGCGRGGMGMAEGQGIMIFIGGKSLFLCNFAADFTPSPCGDSPLSRGRAEVGQFLGTPPCQGGELRLVNFWGLPLIKGES